MSLVRTRVVLLVPVVLLGCEASPVGGRDGATQGPGVGAPPPASSSPPPPRPAPPSESTAPAGGRTAPLDRSEITRLCSAICESTRTLPCGNLPECQGECANSFGLTACALELGAMLVCTAKTPASGFVCGAQGPALRDGTCEAEQSAAATCLADFMQRAAEKNARAE